MPEKIDNRVTQKQADDLAAPMALDLVAVFDIMQNEILQAVRASVKEGWSPEKLLNEIKRIQE